MFPRQLREQAVCRPDYPVACTQMGRIRGILAEGTYIFRGIRYASSRRFHRAERIEPWEGIRDALCYGAPSPLLTEAAAADERFIPHRYAPANENCQYMNIWTQSLDRKSRLPVMVWMHGGGWKNGSSIEQFAYDGENISKSGNLVFVTFNNRQNCYGALDLSSFGKEYEDSVMAGLSDVIAAMKWIQENIEAFGGDRDNVTLVGQSGGAKRALALMQTPEADGLYHKAALGSFAGERMEVPAGWTRKKIARRMGELTAKQLGLDKNSIEKIEGIPHWRLAEAVNAAEKMLKCEVPDRFRWEPVADNQYFYDDPFLAGFRKETRTVPLMTGSSFGEMASNARIKKGAGSKNSWNESYIRKLLEEEFGGNTEHVISLFRQAYPEKNLADMLFMDRLLRGKLLELSQRRAAEGGKVWNWLFNLESPLDGGLTAWHCSETPFITGNACYMEASYIPGITEALQENMMNAWTAFAKEGDPNACGLPDWPCVEADKIPTMIFDRDITVMTNHDRELFCTLKDMREK